MATDVLNCDGTDPIIRPDWSKVVGNKTIDDGGYVGDLLTLTRAHLEEAKQTGELREEDSGAAYSQAIMDAMKNAVTFELQHPKASIELCYIQAQIDKLICDCDNATRLADSTITLNKANIEKMICECENDTNLTDSKISLNAAQENKLACDCCNSSKISNANADLLKRQSEGFDDNANQKLYDSQINAWSMVFADTELDEVTPSIQNAQVCETYTRLRNRLSGGTGIACQL